MSGRAPVTCDRPLRRNSTEVGLGGWLMLDEERNKTLGWVGTRAGFKGTSHQRVSPVQSHTHVGSGYYYSGLILKEACSRRDGDYDTCTFAVHTCLCTHTHSIKQYPRLGTQIRLRCLGWVSCRLCLLSSAGIRMRCWWYWEGNRVNRLWLRAMPCEVSAR